MVGPREFELSELHCSLYVLNEQNIFKNAVTKKKIKKNLTRLADILYVYPILAVFNLFAVFRNILFEKKLLSLVANVVIFSSKTND